LATAIAGRELAGPEPDGRGGVQQVQDGGEFHLAADNLTHGHHPALHGSRAGR
jgi:hypothetical protein